MATAVLSNTPILSAALTPRSRFVAGPSIGFVKRLQIAQMERALRMLSDAQLHDLGITRAGIPAHARASILN